jgi:hypothetical protein
MSLRNDILPWNYHCMSDRHFLLRAHDCTQEWERYVLSVNRLGEAVEQMNKAFLALAEARDALAQAVLQEADVSS